MITDYRNSAEEQVGGGDSNSRRKAANHPVKLGAAFRLWWFYFYCFCMNKSIKLLFIILKLTLK